MSEINAVPTTEEVQAIRADIENYLVESKSVADYTASALSQYKLDLYNKRGIKFSCIFDDTNDLYFVNTDGEDWNDSNSINMLSNLTISFIFQDFAIARAVEDSQWWGLATYYRAEYDDALKIAKLDVDLDGSGTISEDEEGRSGQTFLIR